MTYHLYEIDDGETHWYSALSEEDAIERYLRDSYDDDMTHAQYVEEYGPLMVSLIPDDKDFTVGIENDAGDYEKETMKAGEWAAAQPGEMIATTCV